MFLEDEDTRAEVRLRACLEELAMNCTKYLNVTKANIVGLGSGKTKLDKERMKLCQREVESIENMSRNLRALVTRSSMKERYKTAQSYYQKLKFLIDDPQHGLPDIFIWLVANNKRVAYHRLSARDILFSSNDEECGQFCGKVQNIFLKLPGKQSAGPSGWTVQAKLTIYLWLGTVKQKKTFFNGIPAGFEMSQELKNSDRTRALAPNTIHYIEKHVFQLRAHIYQARSLIGSDASGLSDPYATVYITEFAKTTQVIEETLSPTWDELLVFDEVLVYGSKEIIKKEPPSVIIEIYDQDKVGKSEFIGRAIAKPRIKLKDNNYLTPTLEWFDITRGTDNAGELLAAFEMLELGSEDLPKLTEPKVINIIQERRSSSSLSSSPPPNMTILPVPKNVRPNLSKFRIEILFWGLRDLKRVHFMSVDKPRIDIECSGKILSSSIIQNTKKNPNFPNMLKFFDLELPLEEIYAPPITIRCVDCRSFGRYTLVGTNQITSIHRYMHRIRDDLKKMSTCGQIILTKPDKNIDPNNLASPKSNDCSNKSNSNENLTIYGAAYVGRM